ncbi:two-CW domain-containing protein [Paludibaculum fermentans]|uniref:two-CW domain-containing protein n=1 Tax=Paludibaculum fermentans TaxID=1473598 RepID=UPI003EBCC89A
MRRQQGSRRCREQRRAKRPYEGASPRPGARFAPVVVACESLSAASGAGLAEAAWPVRRIAIFRLTYPVLFPIRDWRFQVNQNSNCWDVKKCGRQPGGSRSADLGICPAAVDEKASGLNGGQSGGRVCWALTGTLCGGTVQGSFAQKLSNCMQCDFYQQVQREEGKNFQSFKAVQARL